MARDKLIIEGEIARLNQALSSGVRSVSTEGISTTFESAADMRKRLGELTNELDEANGGTPPSKKPRVRGINLESAW